MQWEQIESNWDEFKKIIKQDWAKLTDAQLNIVAGRRDYLVRQIQAAYAMPIEDVEAQLNDWQAIQINIDGHFYQTKPFSSIYLSK